MNIQNQGEDQEEMEEILIVDDVPFNVYTLKMILHHTFHIDTRKFSGRATNGQEAVEKVRRGIERAGHCNYKLILMDCQMPIMDGY